MDKHFIVPEAVPGTNDSEKAHRARFRPLKASPKFYQCQFRISHNLKQFPFMLPLLDFKNWRPMFRQG
jgi:hypothetical protein